MASVFHSFPPPVGPGYVTVGEQDGELGYVQSGQAKTKVNGILGCSAPDTTWSVYFTVPLQ